MYMLFLHEAIGLVHEILIPRNNNTFLNGNDVFYVSSRAICS